MSFPMPLDDAIVRLARQIDAARKAERLVVNADEVASLRRHGVRQGHPALTPARAVLQATSAR